MKLYASLKRHVSAFWSQYISLKTFAYILFYAHRTRRDLHGANRDAFGAQRS